MSEIRAINFFPTPTETNQSFTTETSSGALFFQPFPGWFLQHFVFVNVVGNVGISYNIGIEDSLENQVLDSCIVQETGRANLMVVDQNGANPRSVNVTLDIAPVSWDLRIHTFRHRITGEL